MLSQAIIPAIQVFGATLAFVTVCLTLTKSLVDGGFLKKLVDTLFRNNNPKKWNAVFCYWRLGLYHGFSASSS